MLWITDKVFDESRKGFGILSGCREIVISTWSSDLLVLVPGMKTLKNFDDCWSHLTAAWSCLWESVVRSCSDIYAQNLSFGFVLTESIKREHIHVFYPLLNDLSTAVKSIISFKSSIEARLNENILNFFNPLW